MTVEWITAITDRTYEDVQNVLNDPELENPKGAFNFKDLNRIENNTKYCMEYMMEKGIIDEAPDIRIKLNWRKNEVVTYEDVERIITNILTLGELSNPEIKLNLPILYVTNQMNYILANQIEEYLNILHTQAETPADHYYVDVIHGKIVSIESLDGEIRIIGEESAWVAEGEIVTIEGQPYGEEAEHQRFVNWTTYPDGDVEFIEDVTETTTTYIGQAHETTLVANFIVTLPRTLTLTNAYISPNFDPSVESGPTTGTYHVGDRVMIIANIAPEGKEFFKWTGTQAAINNMSETEIRQSTVIFTMPDCDTDLQPFYVNAGPHWVRIYSGNSVVYEHLYYFEEYFTITAPNRGEKYNFVSWSGDTQYLDNIYHRIVSGLMPDVNLIFRANYDYIYSYNTITMTQGTIDGNAILTNARESSIHTIQSSLPTGQGFDYWSINGLGIIQDEYSNPTTFIVGDGNATITPHFNSLRTLSIVNKNNEGGLETIQKVQGKSITIETAEVVGDYIFSHWSENDNNISNSYIYTFDMPSNDRTLTAVYREKNNIQVEINYGNHTEIVTMLERAAKAITADAPPVNKEFDYWFTNNIYSITDRNNSSTSFISSNENGTIIAMYRTPPGPITKYILTVNNGSGTGEYVHDTRIDIEANMAPLGYEFDYWEVNSGSGYVANPYSNHTKFNMGDDNAEITAHYKQIPSYTIHIENGYVLLDDVWVSSGTCLRNSSPKIKMKPAPRGYRFDNWSVIIGNQNDIVNATAETTTLRNVTHHITVRANYYEPSAAEAYTLTMHYKDGTTSTSSYLVGRRIEIEAEEPDEGYRFYRWSGDYEYLEQDRTVNENVIKMPSKNIDVWASYVPIDYVTTYHLYMYNAECLISRTEDEETHEVLSEVWDTEGDFVEGTEVEIRPLTIVSGYKFDGWYGANEHQEDCIDDLENPNTFITIPDFDCHISASTIEENKYTLNVIDGQKSGHYEENSAVPVYFDKLDTEDIHYVFTKWTGDNISRIKLYDGGPFDTLEPGDKDHPQYIRMLAEKIKILAQHIKTYRLVVYNGTTPDTTEKYFEPNTTINIVADTPPEGYTFAKWEGDIDNIGSRWDPTTTITITDHAKSITATYTNLANRNNIGFVLIDLLEYDSIDTETITVIAGEIEEGFIITDSNGQLYIITSIEDTTATIVRLTRIQKGGNIYE